MRKFLIAFCFIPLASLAQEKVDLDMIGKIKKEGTDNSHVMEIAFHLTDVSGPRLTASPGFMRAANWAKDEFTKMGLVNAQLEPWGEFGKGWQQEHCYVAMTAPYYQPLLAIPRAWTGGTPGKKMLSGEIVLLKIKDTLDFAPYTGKLKGKIVMIWTPTTLKPSFEADAGRFTDSALEKMAAAEPKPQVESRRRQQTGNWVPVEMQRRINQLLNKEKPALILSFNPNGNDGTVFVGGGGSYAKDAEEVPANVMLSSDDYLRLQRLIGNGQKVEIEADVKTSFYKDDLKAYNVLAEIPGTDPTLKSEVVMMGGHLDSWHAATGATDNAAGCAVMMEAVRILKALNVQPRRTIRIALWSGEEEGLFGSRNYVKNHFADPAKMELMPEHSTISAYYNLDNGSGKIRGVYLQQNQQVRPIFNSWLAPFNDMGAKTLTIDNTGGTDHLSFDAVGIPGFQFIQDKLEYDTRTHHTNMDTYDHLVADDLKQAAIIVASFVYNTAQRDAKIPRKELPKP
ncbi:peptidase M28 [Niastella koreensis]|uniref:Carboxypeptidase Q n=2 Tax=Niastella koreensis TaxID=354356 RepID=G8TN92_NIAKG|nr:M20/M25/M40 family metallo-hydrolase [Niastella koreensis]AEV98794.1 peptidase M28 [Niastella koreensis GR20-10]OQP43730.1 peptidase M28 [Niastella koreensis]